MRRTVAAILVLLAAGLFLGSITMNWPASPDDWDRTSNQVGWERYALAILMAITAIVTYWASAVFRRIKRHGGGGECQRIIAGMPVPRQQRRR